MAFEGGLRISLFVVASLLKQNKYEKTCHKKNWEILRLL